MAKDCRAVAAACLADVYKGGSLSQLLPLHEQKISERDRPLLRQLCYGVLRQYPRLAAMVKPLLKKPLKTKDQDIFMLMLLGIYQLSDTRIPDHAAINATVNACVGIKKKWAKGLLNGVLRQWQRQQQQLIDNLSVDEQVAHPLWLFDAINKAWPEQALDIMAANNQHPPMCLRVNKVQGSREDYQQQLSKEDIATSLCDFSSDGIRLHQPMPVTALPNFNSGAASVQDEAPQLCASLLSLAPGQRVLDACAAPGGKTCHLLEHEPALDTLIALDIDERRLEKVTENLSRLQLSAQLTCADAAKPELWWDKQPFDRILLDAPCSATGVIRRNPDIKLHRTPADITQLAKLQLKLLEALWPTLKPGGLLLYATCSVLPEENEKVVASFCNTADDAEHITIDADWGLKRDFGRQLFPSNNGPDGFYYALIQKNNG
jgi:16S rRNA (cytosine967-C5)-methyltransferase